jgi:hypothetical protein
LNASEYRCRVGRSFNAGGKVIVGTTFGAGVGTLPKLPGPLSSIFTSCPLRPSVDGGRVVNTAALP